MSLKAGHCTACGALVWRTLPPIDPDGEPMLLWPMPTSRYVTLAQRLDVPGIDGAETLRIPGVAYCEGCVPALGPGVVAVERPEERYAAWFEDRFIRSLQERSRQARQDVDALRVLWEQDRQACSVRDGEGDGTMSGDPQAQHV